MATWKTAPALACGNTVVLKPAEHTPMTAMELARIAADAGIPEGVFNVVPGFGPTAGAALAQHPDVNKIAFTGEYVTGRLVVQMSTSNLKTVTLELGGKSPHIIFDDVDLEAAVANALFGLYTNTGQICSAGTRLLVQDSIYDRFLERFVERSNQIKVGNPLDFATRMGPLVSEEQLRKVERYVQIGQREGARLVCGGGRPKDAELANGFYHEPTVFADVTNQMQIAQEEIFGPVGSVIRFSDEDDAVRIGNDVIYGLAAGVQTRDVKRAHRIAKRLQAGTVWINTWHKIEPNSPFGGYKLSGYGRENGPTMIDHLTRLKQVWVDLNEFTMDLFGMNDRYKNRCTGWAAVYLGPHAAGLPGKSGPARDPLGAPAHGTRRHRRPHRRRPSPPPARRLRAPADRRPQVAAHEARSRGAGPPAQRGDRRRGRRVAESAEQPLRAGVRKRAAGARRDP